MKKLFSFLFAGVLVYMAAAQESSPVLDRISRMLTQYRQFYPVEKIYFQTDKDIYAPGEIIWFSGMLINRTSQQFAAYNQDVAVCLFNESGIMISGDKYPVTGGKMNGDILLKDNIPLGRYYLAAYTDFQDNPDNVYIKPLKINRFYKGDAVVTFMEPEKVYHAGTKASIELKAEDYNGNPSDKFTVNYEIRHNGNILAEGKVRTEAGKAVINALLPLKTGKEPVEAVISHPKNLWTKKLFLKTSADEIDVKFYVEGGTLVGTLPQKTGFYATNWHGTPVDLEAIVTGAAGQNISKVRTFIPGFGLFPLQVKPGEKCRLTISSDYGKGQSFDLPDADVNHTVALIVAKMDNDFIWTDLLVRGNTVRKLAVTATQGHNLLWAANLETTGNARIKIPLSELKPGIVQLCVFDEQVSPQSSRLVYIPDNNKAELKISEASGDNGKLKLTLEVQDENGGFLASGLILTIADTMRIVPDRNLIRQQLALNGELLNPVGDLSLLPEESERKNLALDYALICNELKGFSWGSILNHKEVRQGETPEINTGISGRVTDKKGNPVPQAKINILNNRDMKLYKATADDKGFFRFQEFQPVNRQDLTLMATDELGKGNYQVMTDPSVSEKISAKIRNLNPAMARQSETAQAFAAYLKANPGQLTEPTSVKIQPTGEKYLRVEPYKTLLTTATNLLDVIKTIKPFSLMNGQIVFPGTINSLNYQSGALIVIDGVKMGTSVDILNTLAPVDVDEIKISTDPVEMQRYTALNNVGVIEITTKKGGSIQTTSPAMLPKEQLYRDGIRIPRNFLTNDALAGQPGKDFRTTLFWNPNLETVPAGTTTFSVPLSGIKSGFVISAEGMTINGRIVKASQVVTVR